MKRLLIIGCGDVALRTIPLLRGHYRLYALIRNPEHRGKLRELGVTPVIGDLDSRASLARITGLADVVLHFAPPASNQTHQPSPPDGTTNHSAKPASGQVAGYLPLGEGRGGGSPVVVDKRTRNLLAALSADTLPKQLIYISTSGVYGDCAGNYVSETTPLNPQSNRAKLRVDAEKQIRTWAKRNGVHASILRVPGIYAHDRLPLDRLRAGSPAMVENEDGFSNHIHADDLARSVVATLRYGKASRAYHTVDEDEMKMGDYFDAVADAFDLPRPPRLPRDEVKLKVSPMMWSFMNESRRMTDTRMKQELKMRLLYPTLDHTLAGIKCGT
jgi:nucleoside-diphosphate-sugar epimerase